MPKSIWYDSKFSASEYGTQILDSIMGARETFQYPKSPFAVMESILASSDKISATILDFFAGSGTTGHAVMKLNQEDGGKRQFILCTNNENKIAEEVTYPRIKKVIEGYADEKGIPANVRYFKTDFVKKTASRDEQKMKITERCTEMLCLREGVFTEISDEKSYKIFKDDERVLAVYYAVNHKDLPKLQKELEKIAGEKVLYCFTLNAGELDAREFAEWEGIRLEAIPQKILDIYKEIHEY
jgi:adenine-specific DNA-methyltransferase